LLQPIPSIEDFKNEIDEMKNEARINGEEYIDIIALEIHKRLAIVSRNHRMASCCKAMYDMMLTENGDQIISAPPKGKGSTLKIRYYLK
jgi:hypothetical protein